MKQKSLNILGIRGVPAAHGGFETFASHFAPYMVQRGWNVTVYCQSDEEFKKFKRREDQWEGVRRIHFATRSSGVLSTVEFDFRVALDVIRQPGVDLVLGYNTAIFNCLGRILRRKVAMNMDGIEWKRAKWGRFAKFWFWLNEWIGGRICNVPIADHPEIEAHLNSRGISQTVVIPYGSNVIETASLDLLSEWGLKAGDYFVSIARIEPENSVLEMVEAFVKAGTGRKLMVLGNLRPDKSAYHSKVLSAGNDDVIFPGAIYDRQSLESLRYYCLAYLHGHQVGGTNPSLVEALGAGNPVIAHYNKFNRWTAGEEQLFFSNIDDCAKAMQYLSNNPKAVQRLQQLSRDRHGEQFTLPMIHRAYEAMLLQLMNVI